MMAHGTTKWIFAFLLLAAVSGCKGAGSSKSLTAGVMEKAALSTHVSRAVATPADPIRFEIRLQTDPQLHLDPPQVGDRIQGFRIVNEGKEGPRRVDGKLLTTRWYDLRADIIGSYLLPAVEVSYEDAGGTKTLRAPQIFVEVKQDAQGQESGPGELRDIKPLFKRHMPLGRKLLWTFLVLALLALLAGGIYFAKRWSGRKPSQEEPLSPDAWAMGELEELKRRLSNLDVGQVEPRKKFYFRLSEIFREYLERRYVFPAIDLTTEEILPRMKKQRIISSESLTLAQDFFQGTDLVKFTDLLPDPKDPERLLALAVDFVSRTRPLPPTPLEDSWQEVKPLRAATSRRRR